MIVKLVQRRHNGTAPYNSGGGNYYGFPFTQLGEDLIADLKEKDAKSLIDAGRVKKVSDAVYKEMVAEAEEIEQ